MGIKGYAGWMGSVFLFFFNKNFLYLLWVPLVGLRGLLWGFGVGCGGEVVGVASQMHSGQSAMPGAWPWIGLSDPGEGLGASLIISLMFCNYIKFQNCRWLGWRFNADAIT